MPVDHCSPSPSPPWQRLPSLVPFFLSLLSYMPSDWPIGPPLNRANCCGYINQLYNSPSPPLLLFQPRNWPGGPCRATYCCCVSRGRVAGTCYYTPAQNSNHFRPHFNGGSHICRPAYVGVIDVCLAKNIVRFPSPPPDNRSETGTFFF